jgi:hypothetical protein
VARPHPLLVDVVTGRPIGPIDDPGALVASAIEHRVDGLLWTRVESGELTIPEPLHARLAAADFEAWAKSQMLAEVAGSLTRRLGELGAEIAVFKGIATEARWYSRTGERRSRDLDLLLAPAAVPRLAELMKVLSPRHPLLPSVDDLVAGGWLQSVDFTERLPIDLHVDFFKLELLPTFHPDDIWAHVEPIEVNGVRLNGFDVDLALVNHLIHLNKDGLRRLLGFVDVGRILVDPALDLDVVRSILRDQGVEIPGLLTLDAVVAELRLGIERPLPNSGWRTRAWHRLWPVDRRLTGDAPSLPRHRQFWIAYLTPKAAPRSGVAWLRRWFPPPSLLEFYYPQVPGPYPRRLIQGRWLRDQPVLAETVAPGDDRMGK